MAGTINGTNIVEATFKLKLLGLFLKDGFLFQVSHNVNKLHTVHYIP